MDAASATHEGKQKLLWQAKHNEKVKAEAAMKAIAEAAAKAKAAKTDAAQADAKGQESGNKKSDSSSNVEPTIGICAKVLHRRMTEVELLAVPVHQLGKYVITRITKP